MTAACGDTLWIIDPSLETAEDEGVARIAALWAGPTRLFHPALQPGDGPTPDSGHAMAGVVVMGSAASPNDTHPWLEELSGWLRPLLSGRPVVPVFGICFGHQLIAHLSGGEVTYLHRDQRKRLGIEATRTGGESRLLGPGERAVFVSHREVVTSSPPGFRTVSSRVGVAHDALEHAHLPIFSVQHHPEAGGDFAARAGLSAADLAPEVRPHGDELLEAFMRVCREHCAGR